MTDLWRRFWGDRCVRIKTHLSRNECYDRLVSAVDQEKWALSVSGYAGCKRVLARFQGDTFRLQGRIYYRNNFRRLFYGRFVQCDEGTIIEGEFRISRFAKASLICGFSFLALLLLFALFSFVSRRVNISDNQSWLFLVVPLGMAAFLAALASISILLGKKGERDVIDLLKSSLESKEIQSAKEHERVSK